MIYPGYPDGDQPPLMSPEGSGSSGVCVMAEALGRNEEQDRLPLRPYAEAGSLFERALRLSGVDRSQLLITNAVWYRPPNDYLEGSPWEHEAIAFCRPMNERLFRERQPRCFLAMGNIAMRELSGMSGHRQGILLTRGFPIQSKYQIPVVGTYHPSYLRRGAKDEDKSTGARTEGAAGRGMDLLGVLIRDIQFAVQVAKSGWVYETEADVEYQERASLSDLANFYNDAAAHPDLPISWDIENRDTVSVDDESEITVNKYAEIYQIQFSLRPKQAIIMDWQDSEPFCKLICTILALPNAKLDYNGRKTDRPATKLFLRDKGYQLEINGDCHDLMDMWHHAQPDLPKGLQHVASFYCPEIGPWKHLDMSRPHWYGGRDVDAPQRIWAKLPADLRKLNIWTGYDRHIFQLSPVLDRSSARGIPVNDEKRREFGTWLDGQKIVMEQEVQALVPEECCNIHPKEGYKRLPPDLRGYLAQQPLPVHGGLRDPVTLPTGKMFVLREFRDVNQLSLLDGEPTYRWCELLSFNPNSSPQLMVYIKHKRAQEVASYVAKGFTKEKAEERAKYKIPRNRKEQRDTTDKKEILALGKRTSDPIFGKIVQVREFGKLRGTYVDGWAPADDGRVHPFFVYTPATGQLGSEDPNAQNVPSEKSRGAAGSATLIALAARFREVIEAPAGYTLGEADYKSFHALMLGYIAQDASYMRLARLDIHSFFAAVGLLKIAKADVLLAKPDDELAEYLAWVKKTHPVVRDGQAKPAILGYGLGMRGQTLWDQNPDSYSSRREAEAVLSKLDATFPICSAWRKQIQVTAHNQKYLTTPHGYIRRFWDVFSNKPVKDTYNPGPGEKVFVDSRGNRWKVGHGTDAEAAISLLVQNPAHGHLKDNMLEIDRLGWANKYGMCNNVHDALWFCFPESLADEWAVNIKTQMELPSAILKNEIAPEGFWCGVDVTIGKNMREREKVKFREAVCK